MLSDLKLFCVIKVSNPVVVDPLSATTTAAPFVCSKSPPVMRNPGLPAGTVKEPSPNRRCGTASPLASISPIVKRTPIGTLDELKKPYVITAMAKGVRPFKLLFKYPVRLALNPFISSIGAIFPQLVSGGAIVAMVLSLPTVGPLMLEALMKEDMYLAGSMLMILSLLGVLGTLVSDLLLMWLDPRIRMEGGVR